MADETLSNLNVGVIRFSVLQLVCSLPRDPWDAGNGLWVAEHWGSPGADIQMTSEPASQSVDGANFRGSGDMLTDDPAIVIPITRPRVM